MAIEDEIGSFVSSIIPISNNELSNAEGWIYLFTFIGLLSVGVFLGVRYILTLQERKRKKVMFNESSRNNNFDNNCILFWLHDV